MIKYRVALKESLYSWVVIQERHWWGWKTVQRINSDGNRLQVIRLAKEVVAELEAKNDCKE